MIGLLDTSVLVDFLRAFPPARDWLLPQADLGVSPIVWLELIEGEENKQGQIRALKLLHLFERIDVLPVDFEWAIERPLLGDLAQKPY